MGVTLASATPDWLDMGAGMAALNGKGGATITAWIKVASATATQGIAMLSVGSPGTVQNARFRLQLVAGVLQMQSRNGTDAAGTLITQNGGITIPLNAWVFVAGTIDCAGSRQVLYVNGTPDVAFSVPFSISTWPATNSQTGAVGAQNATPSATLNGSLGDVRIYDRALTAAEIADLYASEGGDSNWYGLMSRYQLNELAPGASVVAAKDVGVQARHLTTNGTPVYLADPLRDGRNYY